MSNPCSHFGEAVPNLGHCPCDGSCLCKNGHGSTCWVARSFAAPETSYKKGVSTVDSPAHYAAGKIECIEALEVALDGLHGIEAFCTGNSIKYLWRWKRKNGREDLEKVRWYINYMLGETSKQRAVQSAAMSKADDEKIYGVPRDPNAGIDCKRCNKPFQTFALRGGYCAKCEPLEPSLRVGLPK